jgi:hypothetical protein
MHSEHSTEFGIATQARFDATGGKFTPNSPSASESTDARGPVPGPSCHRSADGDGR